MIEWESGKGFPSKDAITALVAFGIGEDGRAPDWILKFDKLTANGEEVPVEVNSIFVTDEWITEFYVDGHLLTVDEEINYD